MTPRTVPGLVMSEADLLKSVKEMAQIFGWWFHHPWRSYHSSKGLPDCILIRPPRLIFAELKNDKSKLTEAQAEVLDLLKRCEMYTDYPPQSRSGLEVYLWRPSMLDEIVRILR